MLPASGGPIDAHDTCALFEVPLILSLRSRLGLNNHLIRSCAMLLQELAKLLSPWARRGALNVALQVARRYLPIAYRRLPDALPWDPRSGAPCLRNTHPALSPVIYAKCRLRPYCSLGL
jgi:hypothetical protein